MNDLTVEEFTSPILVTINQESSIDAAIETMKENAIRHLPVMSEGKIVGIVSDRDLLSHFGKDWVSMLEVKDVMSRDILSVSKNDGIGEVAYQLSSHKVGSALVLDEVGELYGIFTTTDALNALIETFYPEARERSGL